MKLSDLIRGCDLISSDISEVLLNEDPDILSIASDSRQIKKDGLFIAVKGLAADGHDYIDAALEKGAAAVLVQENPLNLDRVIQVKDSRKDMARIAANFYGHPSKDLTLVGITGTNGKTTITWLLESIFKTCGFNTGVIGTINIRYNGKTIDNPVTTPDSIDLQKTLSKMKNAGVTHVIMEVSSHGLDLRRVDNCSFDAGVFTNLTQDHLDYHPDMDAYFNCKKRFFTDFLGEKGKNNAPAILNIDDPKGEALFYSLSCPKIGVSTRNRTDVHASEIRDTIDGLTCTLSIKNIDFSLSSGLTGTFNLENILCAAGAAFALNIDPEKIRKGLEACHTVPGRLEKLDTPLDRHIFVDYAHTPGALESILVTLKKRAPKRVITVFGCGGDRDRSKRSLMGQIACRHSDIAIITSDNPRTEAPESIIRDICSGLDAFVAMTEKDVAVSPFRNGYLVETDRKNALALAVSISKPGDIILAAGKGHETYQITNSGTIHFDDREELTDAARKFEARFVPIEWTLEDLAEALNTSPFLAGVDSEQIFSSVSTDSRSISDDQVFLALKGESFDGHSFIGDLAGKGIKGFIIEKGFLDRVENKEIFKGKSLIIFETENTLTALGQLARYQRVRSGVKLVAITGSSGKTTTRRITEEIFKTWFHTHATRGNFNNEIGLPLTLLGLSAAHEWAVVEMGMNHPGELSRLSRIAKPDIAMVINTAGVHLEGLGTVENVARAKAEIFDGMQKNGTAILFSDDPRRHILEEQAKKNPNIKKILFFGSGSDADVSAENIESDLETVRFSAVFDKEAIPFTIHSPARFMVDNCLAALCTAKEAGIGPDGMQKGISAFLPEKGRMNILGLSDSIHLIDDTYNANPASVSKALNTLAELGESATKIAVLGDMLELGEESDRLHREIGEMIAGLKISKLFVFGEQMKQAMEGAVENGFPETDTFCGAKEEIVQEVLKSMGPETWILVKGSRGMAMEKVIHGLRQILTVNS